MKRQIKRLIEAANDLNSIVEGISSVRWKYKGARLKDRPEWCAFYTALKAVNDETARISMEFKQNINHAPRPASP